MGSAGMKRKGRRHLPKVGTRPANDYALHERRAEALHPFSTDPSRQRGARYRIAGLVVALVVAIGVVALIVAT